MNLFQTTDHHVKDDEPFFNAGVALFDWIYDFLKDQVEPFYYLNSGDIFDRPMNSGRVNGAVVKFFLKVAELPKCEGIIVVQGNHDVRTDTGSALDILEGLHEKIEVLKKPTLKKLWGQPGHCLFIPHMPANPNLNYYSRADYGKEAWWRNYFPDWDSIKPEIEFVSAHLGDETSGIFNKDADLSFISGRKSHGHIHCSVSDNHLESAMITRISEMGKKCILREWDISDFKKGYKAHVIPNFLNFARVLYNPKNIDLSKELGTAVTSLVVDIDNAEDEALARSAFEEKYMNSIGPKVYIRNVAQDLRSMNNDTIKETLTLETASIKSLFEKFADQKGLGRRVRDLILASL